MKATTVEQLRELASGDSYAAFKSAALAVGLTEGEAEAVWQVCNEDVEVESDVRESGMEIRGGRGEWLASTTSVELEGWR
jgi:hypothetical protein